ncbi:MAG: SH3 domain-containing protein [Caldilineaceae bacterium]|nr:SH3 domain-containing protein [Caldilineaceae bacterium]
MKKVLAVLVSIFWLSLIIGIPYLALSGSLAQFVPESIQARLDQLGMGSLITVLNPGATQPATGGNEPLVTMETATPVPVIEPTATAVPPTPTPLPLPTETPLPEPTPTADSVTQLPTVSIPVAVRGQAELRTGPGAEFDAVGLVDAGATILISGQDESGEWFQLENGNWIPGESLASKPPVPVLLPTPDVTPEATPATSDPAEVATPVTPVAVQVNADANLRSGPGGTFDRVDGANFGSEVLVVGKFATDNWYLLDSGSWIFGELLVSVPDVPEVNADGTRVGSTPAVSAPATPSASSGTPTANILANLRAAPNTTAAITGTAQPGDALSLVGKNAAGDWFKLASGSWIFAELVDNAPTDLPVVPETTTDTTGDTSPTTPAAGEPASTDGTTPATASPATGTATTSVDANLRSGPGTTFDLVGSITAGTALTIVGRNEAGDWLKLDSGSWIFGELVTGAPTDLPVTAS